MTIGIKAKNGAVIMAQRKIDEYSDVLVDQSTVRLVEQVAPHIGITYSGLQADFRPILAAAREYAVMYETTYSHPVPVRMLCKSLAQLFQEKTQYGGVRPFGCSVMLAGLDYEEDAACGGAVQPRYALYQIDPSGSYFKIHCWANGRNNEKVREQLEKRASDELAGCQLDDAVICGLGLMSEAADIELGPEDIVAGVCQDGRFRLLRPDEVAIYFKSVE